ncbi:DNA-binding protein Roi [Escherichia coli M056]|nr:DNA-binding protein Roi [Escherichia coli M056]
MQVSENINKLGFNVQQWLTRKLLEHGMLTVAGAAA